MREKNKRIAYSNKMKSKKKKQIYRNLNKRFNVDRKIIENICEATENEVIKYSDTHFNLLYKIIKAHLQNKNVEEIILYINYQKSRIDDISNLSTLSIIWSFLTGFILNGIKYMDLCTRVLSSLFIIVFFIIIVTLLNSPKYKFYNRVLDAVKDYYNST